MKKFAAIILLFLLMMVFTPISVFAETTDPAVTDTTGEELPSIKYYRSKVLRVETVTIEQDKSPGFDEIKQISEIEIEQGAFKDRVYTIENYVKYSDPQKIILQVGDKVMVSAELTEDDSEIQSIHIYDYYRIGSLVYSAIITVVILLAISLLKGLRSLVTMSLMIAGLMFYFVPAMLKGYSPILLIIPLCILIAVINIIWDVGFGTKGFSALLGTLTGIIVAAFTGLIMEKTAHLVGLGESELTMLNFMPTHASLDYSGLMFASVMLITLGAVADVCIDMVEEMHATRESNPYINKRKLFFQGLSYGRAYMSRNVNTIFYTLIAMMLPVWILFVGYSTPVTELINMDVLSIQLFRAMAAIIGIVVSMPVTAYLYTIFSKRNSLY